MKRFFLSPSTLSLLLLAVGVTLIAGVAPLRLAFGRYIWDHGVLGLYTALRLYYVWPLFLAAAAFFTGGYLLSREVWWRYALNDLTLGLVEKSLELPGFEELYAAGRRWLAGWYPWLRWQALAALPPALQTAEFRSTSNEVGYLAPNRRYLAALRTRMDAALAGWQDDLLARHWQPDDKAHATRGRYYTATLERERQRWAEHFLLDLPAQQTPLEPQLSLTLITLEHLATAYGHERITGEPAEGSEALARQAVEYLELAGARVDLLASAFLTSLQAYTGEASKTQTLLGDLQALLASTRRSPARTWAAALTQALVVLAMERLIVYSHYQEIIQLHYAAQTLEQSMALPATLANTAAGAPQHASGPLTWLWSDQAPIAEEWAVALAGPAEERWRAALLAEAWSALRDSLLALYQRHEQAEQTKADTMSVAPVDTGQSDSHTQRQARDPLARARLWAIRRGGIL